MMLDFGCWILDLGGRVSVRLVQEIQHPVSRIRHPDEHSRHHR